MAVSPEARIGAWDRVDAAESATSLLPHQRALHVEVYLFCPKTADAPLLASAAVMCLLDKTAKEQLLY